MRELAVNFLSMMLTTIVLTLFNVINTSHSIGQNLLNNLIIVFNITWIYGIFNNILFEKYKEEE